MPQGVYPRRVKPVIVPIGPSIAYVELSRGQWALIDREDADRVGLHNWCVNTPAAGRAYAISQSLYLHRFVVSVGVGLDVDHKNRNGLDNRKSNLRPATRSQNCANMGTRRASTGGAKGVTWSKQKLKWKAYIGINGEKLHLGYFETRAEGERAYLAAAQRYFGEFARVS
jgi:hypothetical protein